MNLCNLAISVTLQGVVPFFDMVLSYRGYVVYEFELLLLLSILVFNTTPKISLYAHKL